MTEWLARRFEEHRPHLRRVAYRMLGSFDDAEDAVQEAWLRLSRSESSGIANLGGCLTTVVGRICLDTLRSRRLKREDPLELTIPDFLVSREAGPEDDAMLADCVGLALLVVLDTLTPAERLAFVLHDLFALPFDENRSDYRALFRSGAATRQPRSPAGARRGEAGDGPGAPAGARRCLCRCRARRRLRRPYAGARSRGRASRRPRSCITWNSRFSGCRATGSRIRKARAEGPIRDHKRSAGDRFLASQWKADGHTGLHRGT